MCRERIMNRRVNAYTGSISNIVDEAQERPENLINKLLNIHPKDKKEMIEAELTYYCEQYGPIRNYCGNTATIVNANQSKRWIYECICAIISRGTPTCPPRQPCPIDKESATRSSTTSITTTIIGSQI